jgi:hypothetical protein
MWMIKRKKYKELCETLGQYSVDELGAMVRQLDDDFYLRYYADNPGAEICYVPPGIVRTCISYLKENSKKVNKIINKHHNDIATMVYSLGLVVGNQLIQTGTVNSMTAVYTLLMYLAKVGLDKVLSDSKDSSDDTSDEGKGDTK